ncbi:hypothetical protein Tco_0351689 [Tanacetum coccineum]
MHKEAQQAVCGPTSLGATSKDGAHPQLSSDQTKSVTDGLKTTQTDSDTRSACFTPNSPQDEPIIVSDESEEEEEVAKDKDTHASSHDVQLLQSQKDELEQQKAKAKAEVASLKARPSYPDINQLTNLLVTSLKPEFSKLLASHDFASCLPNALKELPSKFIKLSREIKELKKHVQDMEIELPGFATVVENASKDTTKDVPSADQATTSPAKGEKNTTKDAETNLQNELVDLFCIDVVEQYHNKKLLFDKYYDKMLKRRKSSKIINCDVITQKGPISLKVYRKDGTIEVIANFKGRTKEEVERKLKETLGLLAQQKLQSDETLKTQAYDILQKEKEQLKKDFKISQDKDIEKLIALENQVKFLNDIVYKTNQSVQTIHMLAPNSSSSYNGRPGFKNPKYLKKAQSEKLYLYKVSYDKDDLANIFAPNYEETLILVQESRSKLDKEKIKKKFAELVRHFISLELSLKQRNEVLQYNRPCQNKDAPGFPEFFEINELKAQIQDKKTVINELKKLIEKLKGKSVDTKLKSHHLLDNQMLSDLKKPSV